MTMRALLCGLFSAAVPRGAAQNLPSVVYVKDAVGDVLLTNGIYQMDSTTGCYKKDRMQLWLCTDAHGLWAFQPKEFLHSDQSLMISTQKHSLTPIGAGPWRVWEQIGKDGHWAVTDADVSEQAPPDMVPLISPMDLTMNQTIGGLLFGLALLAGVLMSITSSTNENIRAWAWRLVSSIATFVISFLFVQGTWDLLVLQVFPAPFPRGFGMEMPVRPGIKIVTSFSIFTFCIFLLNIAAWKVQYRQSRLMVVKTLGAHITGVFGIMAFELIQSEATWSSAAHFKGIIDPDSMRQLAAFAVVGLAWLTFGVYRWASVGFRQDKLRLPPTTPWPPASVAAVAASATQRTCMPFSTTPKAVDLGEPSWCRIVNDAEDEAATVVIGFVTAQAILFLKTQQFPGFKSHYTYTDGRAPIFFLICALAVTAMIFVVVLASRTQPSVGAGGRWGKILQRSIGMTFTWLIYRVLSAITRTHFDDNSPFGVAVNAIVINLLCAIGVVISDKLADFYSDRSAPTADGAEVSVKESTMRGIVCYAGLVCALAWQFNIESSMVTVVQSQEFLSRNALVSTSLLTLFLAVILVLPWRRTILPRSEMREMAHLDDIQYELSTMNEAENFTR